MDIVAFELDWGLPVQQGDLVPPGDLGSAIHVGNPYPRFVRPCVEVSLDFRDAKLTLGWLV